VFLPRERRTLAGRARWDDPGDALGTLKLNERSQGRPVNRPRSVEGGYRRRVSAAESEWHIMVSPGTILKCSVLDVR